MKDAECSEAKEKSNFRFLFFELWSFLYPKYGKFLMNLNDSSKKNRNIFIFHLFQNVPQLFGPKNHNGSF